MGDIGEWATMDEAWGTFKGLNEVWFDGVFEKSGHRTDGMEIFGCDWFVVIGVGDDHSADSFL